MTSTISSKGQVTIPKSVRDEMKVGPGSRLRIYSDGRGGAIILPLAATAAHAALNGRRTRIAARVLAAFLFAAVAGGITFSIK